MERYVKLEQLGRGSFGVVWRAFDKHSCEYVAIKQLIQEHKSWDDCLSSIEVKALMESNHPNIVKLRDIVHEYGTLYLVFEYMETDVYKILQRKILSETMVRNMCFQVFRGLAYLHRKGYIHRDLKPSNLLMYKDSVKISDLGMVRETNSELPFDHDVTTEMYRAPEVFLRSPEYDTAIDMWAMGAIMAEFFINKPLFGWVCELTDVMSNICELIGTPTKTTWLGGLQLANDIFYSFPQFPGVDISAFLPNASSDAIHLISSLLSWDPSLRPTAEQALLHPFFDSCYQVPRTIRVKYSSIDMRNSVPPGFEKLMPSKLIKERSCLNTCKGGFNEEDCLEGPARFLPQNLLNVRNSVPPGFEKLMHPKLIKETSCLNTYKGGFSEDGLEGLARFLPRNLLDVINSVPPGFEKLMHPRLIKEKSCLNTWKGGYNEDYSEDLASSFLPHINSLLDS